MGGRFTMTRRSTFGLMVSWYEAQAAFPFFSCMRTARNPPNPKAAKMMGIENRRESPTPS